MADVTFTIEFDDQGNPVLKNIRRSAEEMGQGAENAAKRASGAFTTLQARIVTLNQTAQLAERSFRSLATLVQAQVRAATDFARIDNALRVATGSAKAAATEFDFIAQQADRLGLDVVSAADQFAKLSAAARGTRLEGEGTRDIFVAVSEASTVMGLSAAETAGALTAIQQIISKGTVSAEELRGQLGERLPGAFQIAARSIGVTTQELGKLLQQGGLAAEDLLPRMAAEMQRTFGPQVQNAAAQTQAEINRFTTSVSRLRKEFNDAGFGETFNELTRGATSAVDALREIAKTNPEVVRTIGLVVTSLAGTAGLAAAAGAATLAVTTLTVALGPVGLIATLLAAAGSFAILKSSLADAALEKTVEGIDQKIANLTKRIKELRLHAPGDVISVQGIEAEITRLQQLRETLTAGAADIVAKEFGKFDIASEAAARKIKAVTASLTDQNNELELQLVEMTRGAEAAEELAEAYLLEKIGVENLTGAIVQQIDRRRQLIADLARQKQAQADLAANQTLAAFDAADAEEGQRLQALADRTREIGEVMAELRSRLSLADQEAQLFGNSFDALSVKISATKDAISQLLQQGLDPLDPRLVSLKDRLKDLEQTQGIQQAMDRVGQAIQGGITDSLRGVMQGTQSVDDAFRNMAQNVVLAISDMVFQLLVLEPILEATKNLIKSIRDGGSGGGGLGIGGGFNPLSFLFPQGLNFSQFSLFPIAGIAHQGGMISEAVRSVRPALADLPRFQTGGEVPILAQSGEFILRRSAVAAIGPGAAEFINREGKLPAGETNLLVKIDIEGGIVTDSPFKKKEDVIKVAVEDLSNDGDLRRAIRAKVIES